MDSFHHQCTAEYLRYIKICKYSGEYRTCLTQAARPEYHHSETDYDTCSDNFKNMISVRVSGNM